MAHPIKRILVPVDFHVPSRVALSLASQLAAPLGASVDILHAADLPPVAAVPVEGHVPVPTEYRRDVARAAEARLADWLSGTEAPADAGRLVVDGRPAEEIVKYASEHGVDLIVMGTSGGGPLAHLFTGSVTEKVIRTARCPVVAVRGPKPQA